MSAARPEAASFPEPERGFEHLCNTAPVMIWTSGPDKLCNFFNVAWLNFTGRSMADELGNGWAEGVHADDLARCLAVYTTAFDARRDFRMEYRLRRRDGQYRWIDDTGTPRHGAQGEFLGYIGSCVDIHDLKCAVSEKELLMRELQHRVSNNLQLIASLIMISADSAKGAEARRLAEDLQRRIGALGLVHRQLSAHAVPGSLSLRDFMEELANWVAIGHGRDGVRVQLECDEAYVPSQQLIPLTLALNEIVVNAYKHAFPGRRAGEILIRCERRPEGLRATVADDGIGMSGATAKPWGGTALVGLLTRQVGGEVTFASGPGTVVTILIPLQN